jgi:carbonic anhydrase/acetyltransferase-like protein (isoleucine patch superfamily)
VNSIKIGENTSIGDRAVVHVSRNGLTGEKSLPTLIGDNVTIGQGALLHGCTIEDNAMVDIGATVMDGAVVSNNSVLGTGALLPEGQRVPTGEFWAGSPAKFVRKLTESELTNIKATANRIKQLADKHDEFHSRSAEDQQNERERIWNIADRGEIPPEHLY